MYKLWVNDCDDHAFISLLSNTTINTNTTSGSHSNETLQRPVELRDDFNILQPPGFEIDSYNNLTHKIYLSLKYLYKNKKEEFDWILKADDDTLIFVDNLRRYVLNKNPQDAITFGHLFKDGYNSGGAGYVMSKEAFNRIGVKLTENYSFCQNTGIEDVDIASCFRLLNVSLNPALDEMGRETFHPLDIDRHFNGKFDGIYEWFVYSATFPLQKVIFSKICEFQNL
jgi:glycoprotein-N-acetylgalactosamine 3-beta-galactosyltransferase